MIVGESKDSKRWGLGLHVSGRFSGMTVVLDLSGVKKSLIDIK